MRTCVVNVAAGRWYPMGQARLVESLWRNEFPGDVITWCEEFPPDSPSHYVVPYAFKLYAIREARRRGYDIVIWMDSSVWAIKSIAPVLAIAERQGYCLWDEGGWSIGQWCTDSGLKRLNLTREAAFTIPLTLSKIVVLNFQNELSRELYDSWFAHASDGISFVGPWTNDGTVSADPRVLGHRHDMPSLAYHAKRLGMHHFSNDDMFEVAPEARKPQTIFLACGIG